MASDRVGLYIASKIYSETKLFHETNNNLLPKSLGKEAFGIPSRLLGEGLGGFPPNPRQLPQRDVDILGVVDLTLKYKEGGGSRVRIMGIVMEEGPC